MPKSLLRRGPKFPAFQTGRWQEITWSSGGINSEVSIKLVCDDNGQQYQETIIDRTENDGSYTWELSGETHNSCRIVICDADHCTVSDESDDLFSIVASDSCMSAGHITEGYHVGTLDCATNDGSTDCDLLSTPPDVWYTYTAQCAGQLSVSTCGSNDLGGVDLGTDTVLSLHSRCPQIFGSTYQCNDNFSPKNTPPSCSALDQGDIRDSYIGGWYLDAGESVLIRVSKNYSHAYRYFLNLSFYPPFCRGDLDCDGDVDGKDLAYFSSVYSTACPASGLCSGDFDMDTDIDQYDMLIQAENFGKDDPALCQDLIE